MAEMMKALYCRERKPDAYELTERPKPTPGPGEVLIRVDACGICHTDINIRAGVALHPVYPFIPGHEFAGTIVEVGPGVTRHKVGDRGGVMQFLDCLECRNCLLDRTVYVCETGREMGAQADGGFAEYCKIPAENFVPVPDNVSMEEACMVEPLANAVYVVEAGKILPNDNVVVIGPGSIGVLCAVLAEFKNPSQVILVGTRDSRLAIARDKFGVKNTINIREEGSEEKLMAMLGKQKADVVIEAAGSKSALELAMRIHAPNARIVLEGTPPYEDTVPFNRVHLQPCASVIDATTWRRSDYYDAMRFVTEGKIDIKPLMTQQFPLERWTEGFDLATNRKDNCLKVVINPTSKNI